MTIIISDQLSKSFTQIIQSRLQTLATDECQRLFHGRGGCYPGLGHINVEKYGQVIALVCYQADFEQQLWNTIQHLAAQFSLTPAIQRRWQPKSPWEFGKPDLPNGLLKVTENGLTYLLRFDRQNPGLFLDMSEGRRWVFENSKNKRIANLFSYTCAFSVAAAAGGALETVNMDMSRAALNLGSQNLKANHLDGKHRMLAHDILKSLGKISRLGPYDTVIIDPPVRQSSFNPVNAYRRILKRVDEWLVSGGWLMLTMNDPEIDVDEFKEFASESLGDSFRFASRIDNPAVIEELNSSLGLKVLLFQKD